MPRLRIHRLQIHKRPVIKASASLVLLATLLIGSVGGAVAQDECQAVAAARAATGWSAPLRSDWPIPGKSDASVELPPVVLDLHFEGKPTATLVQQVVLRFASPSDAFDAYRHAAQIVTEIAGLVRGQGFEDFCDPAETERRHYGLLPLVNGILHPVKVSGIETTFATRWGSGGLAGLPGMARTAPPPPADITLPQLRAVFPRTLGADRVLLATVAIQPADEEQAEMLRAARDDLAVALQATLAGTDPEALSEERGPRNLRRALQQAVRDTVPEASTARLLVKELLFL